MLLLSSFSFFPPPPGSKSVNLLVRSELNASLFSFLLPRLGDIGGLRINEESAWPVELLLIRFPAFFIGLSFLKDPPEVSSAIVSSSLALLLLEAKELKTISSLLL
eukprot:Pgem_evm2s18480